MKTSSKLPDYNEGKPNFQSFFPNDNDDEWSKELMSTRDNGRKVRSIEGKQSNPKDHVSQKINKDHIDQKINYAKARSHANQEFKDMTYGHKFHDDQRFQDMMNQSHANQRSTYVMQNQSNADHRAIGIMKSRFGKTVKLSVKA